MIDLAIVLLIVLLIVLFLIRFPISNFPTPGGIHDLERELFIS